MMTILLRIPLAFVAMLGFQKATTPPHDPPSTNEGAPSTSLEVVLKQRAGPLLVRSVCWAGAFAESAVVLASHFPDWAISSYILSSLAPNGHPERIRNTGLFFLGVFMTSLGGYVRLSCYRALGRLFTFEMSIRKNHQLITDGPYAVVRHPGYLGILLTVTGIVLWHASEGSWARECGIFYTKLGLASALVYLGLVSTIVTGLLSRMSKEDEALKKTFGAEWDEWATKVRYMLIPGVY
ncbi:hypothetical protein NLJ89_g5611 [Agrocybe chaxingu]|uniref:Protein-S-isoprenylcysteine O-methyltransferase n=1 Tax=Agrocybe chaxingu TaxID=84603 RepID=A0A9W8K811_9AGAR|nr:hypothetical protein NLJ89_g5611 [Agrocybe chaxingu]